MTFLVTLSLASLMTTFLPDGAKPKSEKLEITVITRGHFEKNTSELKGDVSYLLIPDFETFQKYFATVPPTGIGSGRTRPPYVTSESFDKKAVAAVIMRSNSVVKYSDVEATKDGDTVTISYKTKIDPPGSARLSVPLFVILPNDKAKKIIFVENGKEVGTAK